ncbi:MAG: carbon-nitrogen hydrolase family protein [Pirellulales bacterium]|nr:carbon-nitrogen hydrolase family protein [Pirellulales bacterium]
MKRPVTIVTIQPPAPTGALDADGIVEAGLALFDAAAAIRPDVVCLPEYFNCMAAIPAADPERFGAPARRLIDSVARRARAARCCAVLPVVIDEGGKRFNRVYVFNRQGETVGHFDKVHLTEVERDRIGVTPGRSWPVFDLDFGRVGIMICYDGCFFESSRILALDGAEVVFWPSLQRRYTDDQLELQTRAHAYFNYIVVVRSSYGGLTSMDDSGAPMGGLSCVCDAEGTILARVQNRADWTSAVVDLARGPRGERSFGGQLGSLRTMRIEDRRPETYGALARGRDGARPSPIPPPHGPRVPLARPAASPHLDSRAP